MLDIAEPTLHQYLRWRSAVRVPTLQSNTLLPAINSSTTCGATQPAGGGPRACARARAVLPTLVQRHVALVPRIP
eukprot:79543-Rhodomonas_salina.1